MADPAVVIEDNASAKILQSVSLNSITAEITKNAKPTSEVPFTCLLCDETFPASEDGTKSPLLAHLLTIHKLIISEVEKIANFPGYISYWKKKFSTVTELTEYCVVINTNTGADDKDPQEKYFLLTSFLPEDQELRDKLNTEKLVKVLDEQQLERADHKFSRRCLFCKIMFHGNRADIFRHMAKDHGFNVGNSDNIVHAAEFIDFIKSKLDSSICLFCEKGFNEWNILKDHMRKKAHKRINPSNKEYDRFYLINYLDPGKNWKEVQLEPEYEREDVDEGDENAEKEYEDWTEESSSLSLCLFCTETDSDVYKILQHMKNDHSFDLHSLRIELGGLSFYHQVKIVNYIRKQVYQHKCPNCLEDLHTKEKLQSHLLKENHYGLPDDKTIWDQPGYFFSTFDDDSLLCVLEDDGEEDENQNITT